MSTCDSCYSSGNCCKRLFLSGGDGVFTTYPDEGPAAPAAIMARLGLPFVAIEDDGHPYTDKDGRLYIDHAWRCTKLEPNGRCGVYEDRPQLCKDFQPGESPLCVHYQGAESGDPTVSLAP